jgi:hypothetical protein
MRAGWIVVGMASAGVWGAAAAADANRFDGTWTTIVECATAPDGAFGYTKQFDSKVTDGMLLGESDREGQPGWLRIELRKCDVSFRRQ